MALEDKLDLLIEALNKTTVALQEAKAGGAVPTADKPATGKPGRPKKEDAAPASKYTADDIKTKFNGIKEGDASKVPALKQIISDTGATGLADLVTKPDKFDAAMAALEALEAEGGASDDDDL